jgi:PAS domain S-box-containing protein
MITSPEKLLPRIGDSILDIIPVCVGIIDREFNLVYANAAFEVKFGSWKNKKCFNVYKKRESLCDDCNGALAFNDGRPRVSEETGYDVNGLLTHYIKHTVPLPDETDEIRYLMEISIDITEYKKMRREYQLLFDQVPCNILLIDRNFQIVRANKKAEEMLGVLEGKHCYEALKGRTDKCLECTAKKTFEDGLLHTGYHVWKTKDGKTNNLYVITIPLTPENGKFDTVMEMAVDITPTLKLEGKLKIAHSYLESLINTSMDGIIGVNNKGKVTIFNPAARKLFKVEEKQIISRDELNSMLPLGFLAEVSEGKGHVYLPETELKRIDGESFPARLVGSKLSDGDASIGMAFSIQDLSHLKKLEAEKIESERMAIVGQTVAGIAHGIKNLIYSLEGGMYLLSSGLSRSDIKRVHEGMETLSRNIERVSVFVKSFLNYSRARLINSKLYNPFDIAKEVVESFRVRAEEHGIKLDIETVGDLEPASLDYEKMHECITNLIGNAIDACIVAHPEGGGKVTMRIYEEYRIINYVVEDNGCGMDRKTQKKVFNKFFTTKGLDGTGLGLLTAKKNVQEHGGSINLVSKPKKGTTFRIRLPRRKLPKILDRKDESNNE